MDTKNNPDPKGCFHRAEPDEPRFTLLGRDPAAAATMKFWALERQKLGKSRATDPEIVGAYAEAEEFRRFHEEREATKKTQVGPTNV